MQNIFSYVEGCLPSAGVPPDQWPTADWLQTQDRRHLWDQAGQKTQQYKFYYANTLQHYFWMSCYVKYSGLEIIFQGQPRRIETKLILKNCVGLRDDGIRGENEGAVRGGH